MPEIDIERRPQPAVPWWVWTMGAVILALIVWAIIAAVNSDRSAQQTAPRQQVAGERQEESPVLQEPTPGTDQPLPLGAIQQDPAQYHGQEVSGSVTVTEVVSDRGFWVEQNGNRMFVIDGQTTPPARNLSAGQQINLQGLVYRTGEQGFRMPQVEGMDAQTARTLQDQKTFIHATAIQPGDQPT